MKVSYDIASGQSSYVTEKTQQTSKEAFTIPDFGKDKTDTDKKRDFTYFDYDPFKDMAKTGNVELPRYIHTKTTPTRNDAEILKDIEELAKEHARTGQSRNYDKKYSELADEYISSVSPDRESILKKSVQEISGTFGASLQDYRMSGAFQQIDSQRTHKMDEEEKETELIDYLLDGLENEGKDNNVVNEGGNGTQNAMLKSNMYEGSIIDGKIQYIDFFDPDSKTEGSENKFEKSIMMYSSGGILAQQLTKDEWTRQKEAYASYEAAYDVAFGKHSELDSSTPKEYKEAYERNYERLRNETT
jgi:hypothetical protein